MIRTLSGLADTARVWALIADTEQFYPGMDNWFWNRFVPGCWLGRDFMLGWEAQDGLHGVLLAQIDPIPKICCLKVGLPYQRRGLAIHLIRAGQALLPTPAPLVTVPAEHIAKLRPILAGHFGWREDPPVVGLYRPGVLEFVFNAPTPGSSDWARVGYGGPTPDAVAPMELTASKFSWIQEAFPVAESP